MSKRVLLTGAAGFVGTHVLRHLLVHTDWQIICPVSFRHQGRSSRLHYALESDGHDWRERVFTMRHDLTAPILDVDLEGIGEIDYIFNVASESHVDRSIVNPAAFIRNNVELMTNVLDLAVTLGVKKFIHMSTDEVYGPARIGQYHREWDPIRPSNPYSASKGAQEAIAFAYWRTYGVPLYITNTMNIIGETQSPEKFLPMVMRRVMYDQPITIHADLSNPHEPVVGSRCWLHARNLASAWLFLAEHIEPQMYPDHDEPHRFHVVGDELTNLEIAETVAEIADKELKFELVDFHATRPGHDLRYALDGNRIGEYGWVPPVPLIDSIKHTVEWTFAHSEWLL